jgi:hypothetical protein
VAKSSRASFEIRSKRKCCKSNPRCKRCPVVMKRLETAGYAEHLDKRTWLLQVELKSKRFKKARRRALA